MATAYTLGQISEVLELECHGDASLIIDSIAPLATARSGQLSFLAQARFSELLASTNATALIISKEYISEWQGSCLVAQDPYLTYARASHLFAIAPERLAGIHPSAVISPSAKVDASASIGANCVIEDNVSIAANVKLGPGTIVGANSEIGEGSQCHANVSIYHGVNIGRNVTIHSSAVIGADGFGFAPQRPGWQKIAQNGGVSVGDNVEIGACTTIDRGAIDDTVIAQGAIIDNLVQIAHNVKIGENTAVAGCVGIAGSTVIGKNCIIAGAVGIVGHISIVDNVHLTGMTMVSRSIEQAGSYSGSNTESPTAQWKRNNIRFHQLDALTKRVAALEKNGK